MDCKLVLLFIGLAGICYGRFANPVEWTEIAVKCSRGSRGVLMTVGVDADCRLYSSCAEIFGKPSIQTCPAGTLYDDINQICNTAKDVDCAARGTQDPCNGLSDGLNSDPMRSVDQRAAVVACEGGRSVGGYLCPVCSSFNLGGSDDGCQPISGCTLQPEELPNDCRLEPVADNAAQYIAVGENTRTVVNCGNGTVFDQSLCTCRSVIV